MIGICTFMIIKSEILSYRGWWDMLQVISWLPDFFL